MESLAIQEIVFTFGSLTLIPFITTFVLLNFIPIEITAYPAVASICATDPCIEPTVIDNGLKVHQVASGFNAPTKMAFMDSRDILVLERYTGKIIRMDLQDPFWRVHYRILVGPWL
jgi:hypothetical protein